MAHGADRTALGPMVIAAVDQHEPRPLVHDGLAARFLPPGVRALVAAARWGRVRRTLVAATERKVPGLWASVLCRKRYADDQLLAAVERGADSVVVLGAGLDTRAYRLPAGARVAVWEVDLPANIDRKRAALRRVYGRVPDHVTLVPADFETRGLGDVLAAHGHRVEEHRTCFVWEAVTQYLTEEGVRATLDVLSAARPGSRLVFTYVREDFLTGRDLHGGGAAHEEYVVERRLWRFGAAPERVASLLAEHGWREVEQMGAREFTDRYLAPAGRDLPVSEIERSVFAERG
ncbi:SAM-dependent methyltransferase [Thermobifida halotolerans]|uniref:S-adenosyl-L-methionine-dependent methyltransferase n=1 Tax=Thermobifida halotolerans TaxID=483545 RepID=A0A399G9E2_9ACTN|nr:SAM-dependent methyltransferase [Thermobifida halotolerans]UOE21513.1 SAM-dependent methyltransferase [Thermobifida halotolerans]